MTDTSKRIPVLLSFFLSLSLVGCAAPGPGDGVSFGNTTTAGEPALTLIEASTPWPDAEPAPYGRGFSQDASVAVAVIDGGLLEPNDGSSARGSNDAMAVPETGAPPAEGGNDATAPAPYDAAPKEAPNEGGSKEPGNDAGTGEDAGSDATTSEDTGTDASASEVTPNDDATWTAATPAEGDLIISEVMFDAIGPSPQSDWFEIFNASTSPILLSGLTIQDGARQIHVIADSPAVVAPPLAYVVLVRDRSVALSNSIPAPAILYEYGLGLPIDQGVHLDASAAGALSLWNASTLLASVPYGGWGMGVLGESIELAVSQLAGSDLKGNWCVALQPWALGSDYGTPGSPSDCP